MISEYKEKKTKDALVLILHVGKEKTAELVKILEEKLGVTVIPVEYKSNKFGETHKVLLKFDDSYEPDKLMCMKDDLNHFISCELGMNPFQNKTKD